MIDKFGNLSGNSSKYSLDHVSILEDSPIKNKTILFLGSSVTYGYASNGVSFADYITKRNGNKMIKETISGTTLVDDEENSYIARMNKIKKNTHVDLFICQLSTNDATKKKKLGKVTDSKNMDAFDTHTIVGAIEYIISYARNTWNCKVMFYTSPKYNSEEYKEMVALLQMIKEKWDITVIDLYNNDNFNAITEEDRELYMADSIHPTKAGYLKWWTPQIENEIYKSLIESSAVKL